MSLVTDKLDRLESVPTKFLTSMELAQRSAFREVVALLEGLDKKNGVILLNEKNIAYLDTIGDRLKAHLFTSEYIDAVKEFVSEFDTQATLSNDFFKKTFSTKFTDKDIFDAVKLRAKRNALDLLNDAAIDSNVIKPMKQLIETGITTQAPLNEMVKTLDEFMNTTEAGAGKLKSYTSGFAIDSFNRFDRSYTKVLSDDFGVTKWKYQGGLVQDSRDFCMQRAGGVFTKEEIQSWASMDWQGRYRNTDESNIFVVLGGYNCLHSLIPVE